MFRVWRSSLRAQMLGLSVMASTTALLLACAAFLVYDVVTFRDAMVRKVATHAQVIASNATAAILFQDYEAANATLGALRADRHIVFVEIRTPDGKSFARYRRDGAQLVSTDRVHGTGYRFEPGRLLLSHAIHSDEGTIAQLHIESDLTERDARVRRYLVITGLILGVSLIAALLLSARLQRRISDPILDLVQTARTVSDHQNYAVRAATAGAGEVGLLAKTFNEMLNQIERQDKELRRAVESRDEFLSIASHELKTPLTPLQLQVQSLQRLTQRNAATPIHGKLTTGLAVMDKQVVRLTTLVNNLLDISRITSQRLLLNLEEVDLRQLVQEVVTRFRQELMQAGCTLTMHAPDPVIGLWDRSRLDQVATNLLSNAMKYGAGKPIDIVVEGTSDHGRLRVRDNGIGVAPEDQARIFDRSERAVSEHNYGGFGLGLWITRQIVECSGGTILVHSQPGAGATFVVELPLKAPQAAEGPTAQKATS